MVNITVLGLALIVGVVSYGLLTHGVDRTRMAYRILTTATSSTANLSDGVVEVKGEIARAVSDPIEGPITTEEAIVADWCVEDWTEARKSSYWNEQVSGVTAAPFYLSDETGEVAIDYSGDGIEQKGWGEGEDAKAFESTGDDVRCVMRGDGEQVEVGVDDEPPVHLGEFVAETSGLDEQSGSVMNVVDIGNKHGDRRYSENRFTVGDELYVLGEYDSVNGVVHIPDDWPMLISNKSETKLLGWRSVIGTLSILVGAVLLPVSLFLLYAGVVG